MNRQVVEIGVEVSESDLSNIMNYLESMRIPYYIEPQRKEPWTSLCDLEAACEGK